MSDKNKKVDPLKNEIPLGEDYQEAGHKYEYESDEARANARKLSQAGKKTNKYNR